MSAKRMCLVTTLLIVGFALVSGCLTRKETIRVHRDGAVLLQVELEGDPPDFLGGDALPEKRGGWHVEDQVVTKDDGKQQQTRKATRRIAAGQPLPDSYVAPDEPEHATALSFPTEVVVERRPDGTYYHFRRVYEGREQARYEYHRHALRIDEALKELAEKDPAELTDSERATLLDALRKLEAHKMAEFVRAGSEALGEVWPQHYGLLLRQALLDYFRDVDVEPVLVLLDQPESDERDAAIDAFGADLLAGARRALREKLEQLDVPRAQIEGFDAAFNEEQARRGVTEDLQDEAWEVRVALPGELVAHNGTRVDGEFVVWEFDGKALMDREVILMATSRVGPSSPARDEKE